MSSADLDEWKRLLELATRPSVKTQIELIISNLESTVSSTDTLKKSNNVFYNTVTSFSWDQSQKYVTVLVPVTEDVKDVLVDVDVQSVDVKFCSGSKHYQLKLKKLFNTIKKECVTWKCKSGYLQVKMEKGKESNWSSLTFNAEKERKMTPPKTDDSNPQTMLMDMMKNLYNEGDDDMKRTIAKAWTEAMDKRGDFKV